MNELTVLNILDQISDPVEAVAILRARAEAELADRTAYQDQEETRLDRLTAAYGLSQPQF